jgi:hypothetical protein
MYREKQNKEKWQKVKIGWKRMKWLRKEKIRKGQQERIGIRTRKRNCKEVRTYRNKKMRRITGCCGGEVERRRKGKE